MLTACASSPYKTDNTVPNIGPYHDFSARLLVMEPKHRWQVMLRWVGDEQSGYARLTHGASGRVLQIRWQGKNTALLDNQQLPAYWRPISQKELAKRGLIVSPSILAAILHNHIPVELRYKHDGKWKGYGSWRGITMFWQPDRHSLSLSDISKGREVRIIIDNKSVD
ncbi:MAG: hypothetical protein Q9M22_01855 [Mariprofundaceae bacterium]|nr:hypothetical protein [Mariprofundaceae bacterium]